MHLILTKLEWLAANWVALAVVLLSFGFIIFVHELGHFLTAKRVGITVYEFALGFGPKLFARTVDGTEYCLRAFPLGGFVRMEGEDDPDANPDDPGSFLNKPWMSQIVVLGGGCFMNYVSALAALLLLGFVHGSMPNPDRMLVPLNLVGGIQDGSPAAKAGLAVDDRIVAINDAPVENFLDVVSKVRGHGGEEIKVSVVREGKPIDFRLVPLAVDDGSPEHRKIGRMGVIPTSKGTIAWVPIDSAADCFSRSGQWITKITLLPFEILSRLTRHEITVKEVGEGTGGPLLIGQMLFEVYHQGIWALLFFWAIICTSVGSFNLLPIPALDGARILFVSIGALRGRPIDPRKEGVVHLAGLVVLLCAMAAFSVHDVIRMWHGVHFF